MEPAISVSQRPRVIVPQRSSAIGARLAIASVARTATAMSESSTSARAGWVFIALR